MLAKDFEKADQIYQMAIANLREEDEQLYWLHLIQEYPASSFLSANFI